MIEEKAFVYVACSCDVHRRCALGFVEDTIRHATPRTRISLYFRSNKMWVYDPIALTNS